MRALLKKKTLWFVLYGIFITVVFLYLLFPGELVKNRLERAINSSQLSLRSSSLHLSFPLGIKLKNVVVSTTSPADVLFQGEVLKAQIALSSFFRKLTYIGLKGKAYGGSFGGNVGVFSLNRPYPPAEMKLNFKNIDVRRISLVRKELGDDLTGKASGAINYSAEASGRITAGDVQVFLDEGTYSLAEPFLGIDKIDFDKGEIRASFSSGDIKLERLEIYGQRLNCFLSGNIIPATNNFQGSRLNLNGTIELLGKDTITMKVTIGGTVSNPVFKYI
ncbi:MAG TPA: type II secretion system protein GspN [Deltaproteobacteria bacterium]|nr:type II secretion system protein GspN [Deltaproteobacteria bacterium]